MATKDIISTRDAYERAETIGDEYQAGLMLAWAIRADDRDLAVAIQKKAESERWEEFIRSLPRFLEHRPSCAADRIEVTDYPELGRATSRCLDCAAHRVHDRTGLPLGEEVR